MHNQNITRIIVLCVGFFASTLAMDGVGEQAVPCSVSSSSMLPKQDVRDFVLWLSQCDKGADNAFRACVNEAVRRLACIKNEGKLDYSLLEGVFDGLNFNPKDERAKSKAKQNLAVLASALLHQDVSGEMLHSIAQNIVHYLNNSEHAHYLIVKQVGALKVYLSHRAQTEKNDFSSLLGSFVSKTQEQRAAVQDRLNLARKLHSPENDELPNYVEATRLFEEVASQDLFPDLRTQAEYGLGWIHYEGYSQAKIARCADGKSYGITNIQRDFKKARGYFKNVAKYERATPLHYGAKLCVADTYNGGDSKEITLLTELIDQDISLKARIGAASRLGHRYIEGKGVTTDYAKGYDLSVRSLVQKNDPLAQTIMWIFITQIIKAENTDSDRALANLFLALICYEGLGLAQPDYARAATFFQKVLDDKEADECEIATAEAYIGELYRRGMGVEKNEKVALEYLLRAKEQKHCKWARFHAAVQLAELYCTGEEITKNREEALFLFRKMALQNYNSQVQAHAYHRLMELEKGSSSEECKQAEKIFKKSNEFSRCTADERQKWMQLVHIFSNVLEAKEDEVLPYEKVNSFMTERGLRLARNYFRTLHLIFSGKRKKIELEELERRAEDTVNMQAKAALWIKLAAGYNEDGECKNDDKAKMFLEQAAGQTINLAAQTKALGLLALRHYNAENFAESARLCTLLMQQQDSKWKQSAADCLGFMHYYGDGVEKDRRRARELFEEGAHTIPHTAYALGKIYRKAINTRERNYKKAAECFVHVLNDSRANAHLKSRACIQLSMLFEEGGFGIERDAACAENYLARGTRLAEAAQIQN